MSNISRSSRLGGHLSVAALGAVLAASYSVVAPRAAHAQTLIFDNLDAGSQQFSNRAAESSPLASLTFASPTTISNIGVLNNLTTAGNLKYVIFQGSSTTPSYVSAPQAAATGLSSKVSAVLNFTFNTGTTYYVGAISDVAGTWSFDSAGNTQGGITSTTANGNDSTYASPTLTGTGGADATVRLYVGGSAAAPEPGSVALLALSGLPAVGMVAARRRRAAKAA